VGLDVFSVVDHTVVFCKIVLNLWDPVMVSFLAKPYFYKIGELRIEIESL